MFFIVKVFRKLLTANFFSPVTKVLWHTVQVAPDVNKIKVQNPNSLAYVTQTTLSVDDTREIINALKSRFPNIQGPDVRNICYATQNRQQAVRDLTAKVELLLVVGAANSSNSNRLRDLGAEFSIPSYLIADATHLDPKWIDGISTIGLTAGASAPEDLVQGVISKLGTLGEVCVEQLESVNENVVFKLPKEVQLKTVHATKQTEAKI